MRGWRAGARAQDRGEGAGLTAGEDALVGQLARLLEAERDRLSPRRVLELLSLLLGERAQAGDASHLSLIHI